jgi:hypothetical protein
MIELGTTTTSVTYDRKWAVLKNSPIACGGGLSCRRAPGGRIPLKYVSEQQREAPGCRVE